MTSNVMADPKTPVEALALALRLGITATTGEQVELVLEVANRLAVGMTAEEIATAKRMASEQVAAAERMAATGE